MHRRRRTKDGIESTRFVPPKSQSVVVAARRLDDGLFDRSHRDLDIWVEMY